MGHISFLLTLMMLNILGGNIDNIKKNTDGSREVGLEINVKKRSKYCWLVTRMQGEVMT
jgi:hypothetical protein